VAFGVDQLIERDGPVCVWCGREVWRRDLTLEHVVPRSRGGHATPENALVACRACNRRRGSRPVDAYVRDLLRDGAGVDTDAIRRSLERLSQSERRAHRDAAQRLLRRLESLPSALVLTRPDHGGEQEDGAQRDRDRGGMFQDVHADTVTHPSEGPLNAR
jgi:hypothetical protein